MKQRIVVGVDDSAGARLALRWAREEASLRGATVDVVHAYHYPLALAGPSAPVLSREDLERSARDTLDGVLRDEGSGEGDVRPWWPRAQPRRR